MKIKYNKKIDNKNIIDFKINLFPRGNYKCVICENETTIDESFSNNGHKLICSACAYELFPLKKGEHTYLDFDKMDNWLER